MNFIHEKISCLPIFIIGEWLILFLLRHNEWYIENQRWIDDIDTVLVSISFVHFFFYSEYYSESRRWLLIGIFIGIMVLLNYLIFEYSISLYYFLYLLNLINSILCSILSQKKQS